MAKTVLANAFSLQMLNLDQVSTVNVSPLTVDQVKDLLSDGFVSAVGHADTATVLSDLLSLDVPVNRVSVSLSPDTTLVVAQLVGGRLPEGATKLPDGFHFKFVKVTLQ